MSSQQTDTRIPVAASRWTKETLEYLNAAYIKEDCTSFTFDNLALPSELRQGLPPVNISDVRNQQDSDGTRTCQPYGGDYPCIRL